MFSSQLRNDADRMNALMAQLVRAQVSYVLYDRSLPGNPEVASSNLAQGMDVSSKLHFSRSHLEFCFCAEPFYSHSFSLMTSI